MKTFGIISLVFVATFISVAVVSAMGGLFVYVALHLFGSNIGFGASVGAFTASAAFLTLLAVVTTEDFD